MYEDLLPVWTAFIYLNRRRPATHDYAPIPLVEITAYCRIMGITDQEQLEEYLHLIEVLDREWLEIQRTKKTDEKDEINADPASGRRRAKGPPGI